MIHNCAEQDFMTASVTQAAWALVLSGNIPGWQVNNFGFLTACRSVPVKGVQDIFRPLLYLTACRIRLQKPQSIIKTLEEPKNYTSIAYRIERMLRTNGVLSCLGYIILPYHS
jgi:hypothetical protein